MNMSLPKHGDLNAHFLSLLDTLGQVSFLTECLSCLASLLVWRAEALKVNHEELALLGGHQVYYQASKKGADDHSESQQPL